MKNDRINIRVDEETKKSMKEAADKLGLSISAYIVMLHKKSEQKS